MLVYPWKANDLLFSFISEQEKNIILGIADSPQTGHADIYTGKSLKFENWKPRGGILSSILHSIIRIGYIWIVWWITFGINMIHIPEKPWIEYLSRDFSLYRSVIESFLGRLLVRCSQLWIWAMDSREWCIGKTILDYLCRRTEPNAEYVRLASLWKHWATIVCSNGCYISNNFLCWSYQLDRDSRLGSTNFVQK